MTKPTLSPLEVSTRRPDPASTPTGASDAETIASYKKTLNLILLTMARGWADRLRDRPARASWTGLGLLGLLALGASGWLDPATLQSLIPGH